MCVCVCACVCMCMCRGIAKLVFLTVIMLISLCESALVSVIWGNISLNLLYLHSLSLLLFLFLFRALCKHWQSVRMRVRHVRSVPRVFSLFYWCGLRSNIVFVNIGNGYRKSSCIVNNYVFAVLSVIISSTSLYSVHQFDSL